MLLHYFPIHILSLLLVHAVQDAAGSQRAFSQAYIPPRVEVQNRRQTYHEDRSIISYDGSTELLADNQPHHVVQTQPQTKPQIPFALGPNAHHQHHKYPIYTEYQSPYQDKATHTNTETHTVKEEMDGTYKPPTPPPLLTEEALRDLLGGIDPCNTHLKPQGKK